MPLVTSDEEAHGRDARAKTGRPTSNVLRRCIRKQNPGPLGHPPKIFMIIEEYNNDLRMKFRTEMIDHAHPRVCWGTFISLIAGVGCKRATLREFFAGPDVE